MASESASMGRLGRVTLVRCHGQLCCKCILRLGRLARAGGDARGALGGGRVLTFEFRNRGPKSAHFHALQ